MSKSMSPGPAMTTSWPPFGSFWNWLLSSPMAMLAGESVPSIQSSPAPPIDSLRPVPM